MRFRKLWRKKNRCNYMDAPQVDRLVKELRDATSRWKIGYVHHLLYSDGGFMAPAQIFGRSWSPCLRNIM